MEILLNGLSEPSTINDPYNIEDHISSRNNHETEVISKIEVETGLVNKCANPSPGRFEVTCRRINLVFQISRTDVQEMVVPGVMASTRIMNLFTCWMEFLLPTVTSRDMWIVDPFWLNLAKNGKIHKFIMMCLLR